MAWFAIEGSGARLNEIVELIYKTDPALAGRRDVSGS
jgi:hypothetical protein